MTDSRKLGIPGIIRQSGDTKDTPGCTLIGPEGTLIVGSSSEQFQDNAGGAAVIGKCISFVRIYMHGNHPPVRRHKGHSGVHTDRT